MKNGMSLNELAAEITRQSEARRDYIAPATKLRPMVDGGRVKLAGFNGEPAPLTEHAHGQMAARLGIPTRYYRRMEEEAPALLAVDDLERIRRRRDEFAGDLVETMWGRDALGLALASTKSRRKGRRAAEWDRPEPWQEPWLSLAGRFGLSTYQGEIFDRILTKAWRAYRQACPNFFTENLTGQERLAWSAATVRAVVQIVNQALEG